MIPIKAAQIAIGQVKLMQKRQLGYQVGSLSPPCTWVVGLKMYAYIFNPLNRVGVQFWPQTRNSLHFWPQKENSLRFWPQKRNSLHFWPQKRNSLQFWPQQRNSLHFWAQKEIVYTSDRKTENHQSIILRGWPHPPRYIKLLYRD